MFTVDPRSHLTMFTNIKRTLGLCAVSVTVVASAGGVLLAGAGTALAPEPARVKENLSDTHKTAAAVFVNSAAQTTVRKWPGTSTAAATGTSLPAIGSPCSLVSLRAGDSTDYVIVAGASSTTRTCW